METRSANIIITSPGGTASKGSCTYKLSLPSVWIKELGITDNSKQVELSFDGTSITISKRRSIDEFISINKSKNHVLYQLFFYDGKTLCSRIAADYTTKAISVENYVDSFLHSAFGNNSTPTWNDYIAFLENRCIPKSRAGLREYLEAIGLEEYDPLEIIKKTAGRMAEDNQWLKVEALK